MRFGFQITSGEVSQDSGLGMLAHGETIHLEVRNLVQRNFGRNAFGSLDLSSIQQLTEPVYRQTQRGEHTPTGGVARCTTRLSIGIGQVKWRHILNLSELACWKQAVAQQNVDLRSSEFDPYLILFRPDKSQEDNDDYNGDQSHSRIVTTLPAAGMYRVSATSYTSGETGAYTLNMNGGDGTPAANSGGGEVVPFEKN
ncbi:MAG: hypothetical protein IIC18_03890 [Bacteroidetes bacterium]|nr:hypothetical protein [Bacteroidota bacterium]